MPVTINWGQQIINIPKDYLTDLGDDMYELDLEQFRLDLKALEETEDGMGFPDTHVHFTQVTIAGQTYARVIQITNGYTVTFEDGQYGVNAVGANSNVLDVMNFNQVSFRGNNSAGLIVKGSGLTAEQVALLRVASQSNYRHIPTGHNARGDETGAVVKVYETVEAWEADENPSLQQTQSADYDADGNLIEYEVKDE
jgi:hypothetical protein